VVIDHPLVGELELAREDLAPTVDGALTLRICTAGAGSTTDERLLILACWTRDAAVAHNTAPPAAH
jgi:hypothetical protein